MTEAAKILRVSRPTLSSLLNRKADLSGEMALRFEKAFGVDMETLMRMQNSYDIARTRRSAGKLSIARYKPRPARGALEASRASSAQMYKVQKMGTARLRLHRQEGVQNLPSRGA